MAFMRRGLREEKRAVRPSDGLDEPIQPVSIGGMDMWDEDAAQPGLARELKAQGMYTNRELDDYAHMLRRGVVEGSAPEPSSPAHGPSLLQRLFSWRKGTEADIDEANPPWMPRSAHEAPLGYRPGRDG